MLTSKQLSKYWKMHANACVHLGLKDVPSKEKYRHSLLRRVAGVESVKLLDNHTYDDVMQALSIDAEDYRSASYYATAAERRWSHLCEVCANQILAIQGLTMNAVNYIIGVAKQAGYRVETKYGGYWLDLSVHELRSLFSMLDTHRRRLLKEANVKPLAFSDQLSYIKVNDKVIVVTTSIAPIPTIFHIT